MSQKESIKIRQENLAFLQNEGYVVNEDLPLLDYSVDFKKELDIAHRINILHILYTVYLEGKKSRKFFYKMIKDQGWQESLSTWEEAFFRKFFVNKQDLIDVSWSKEAIYEMLWATSVIDEDLCLDEIDISDYYALIPPEVDFDNFKKGLVLRDAYLINKKLDLYYNLHWIVKHYESPKLNTNLSLIIERRKSLEWIVNSETAWDDIVLDT